MSSDLLSRTVDTSRYGLIYAGAQKNLGPAGVTLVIARADMLQRAENADLPPVFSYAQQATKRSLLNTPPVFPIYVVGLVLKRLLAQGGLAATEAMAKNKSGMLYGAIDTSGGFYTGHADPGSRSRMNVTFKCPSDDLDKRFVEQAAGASLIGLKGHRSVGGLRASIYNSVPRGSVETLAEFMGEFQRTYG
jgi:phosphoserine aminotransferase